MKDWIIAALKAVGTMVGIITTGIGVTWLWHTYTEIFALTLAVVILLFATFLITMGFKYNWR